MKAKDLNPCINFKEECRFLINMDTQKKWQNRSVLNTDC